MKANRPSVFHLTPYETRIEGLLHRYGPETPALKDLHTVLATIREKRQTESDWQAMQQNHGQLQTHNAARNKCITFIR